MSAHPDEGQIHAWLDDALDASASERVRAHVSSCETCSASVAEARGLIAGASRVLRALDGPSTVAQPAASPAWGAPAPRSRWRVTPARAAIAASLLVALGVTLTYDRTARDSVRQTTTTVANEAGPGLAPSAAGAMPDSARVAAADAQPDSVLANAIARNIAIAQPPRSVDRAPGTSVAMPAMAAPPPGTVADADAPARVAAARSAMQSTRDAASVRPDNANAAVAARAGSAAVSADRSDATYAGRAAEEAAPAGANRRAATARASARPPAAVAEGSSMASMAKGIAPQCLRIESAAAGATWGGVRLPFVMALGGQPSSDAQGAARLLDPASGAEREASAVWVRRGNDSLTLRLRRIGFAGTMQLTGTGADRSGVMQSAQSSWQLSAVVTSSAGGSADSAPRIPAAKSAPDSRRAEVGSSRAEVGAGVETDASRGERIPVTARMIGCPQ